MLRTIDKEVKQIILSKIIKSDYRAVMRLVLDGYSKEEIAYQIGYSVRQVERIVPLCWREVCILLAEDVAKSQQN